ncbi:40s ribosomal protein s12 [Alternaria alternata]|nr:40s ribosomal protein s12 [Alternaria alternata]
MEGAARWLGVRPMTCRPRLRGGRKSWFGSARPVDVGWTAQCRVSRAEKEGAMPGRPRPLAGCRVQVASR